MPERLNPGVFKVPIDKIRNGYYSDKYFTRYVEVLKKANKKSEVLYQFFPRSKAIVVGLDEALAILKFGTGFYRDEEKVSEITNELKEVEKKLSNAAWKMDRKLLSVLSEKKWDLKLRLNDYWEDKWNEIEVKALYDGDTAGNMEPVMTIEGDPRYFGYLETVLLGVIARASSTATAVKKVVNAARGKPVLFFSARFDHFWTQATDGYAALKTGAFGVSTDANAGYWGVESMGTIPHALIAAYSGDTGEASIAFDKYIEDSVNRIALVDWNNDVVNTTIEVVKKQYYYIFNKEFIPGKTDPSPIIGKGKDKLWGVRFDTSGTQRDNSVIPKDESSLGVCPELVWTARKKFDNLGLEKLKIVVSGGFDENKINLFEKLGVPVDTYGVGSSLLKHKIDFTADVVELNGIPCAKVGRGKKDTSRLSKIDKEYW